MNQTRVERLRDEARERRLLAREAARHARERIEQLANRRSQWDIAGLSRAVERRIHADDRLAQIRRSLAEARQRSANAHERAARLDDSVGKHTDANRHRDAANHDRELIDDESRNGG